MATSGQKGAVLITGAAGGIGTATARHLDSLGFCVFAGVRKGADGEALRRSISSSITPVHLDITDPASLSAAAETVAHEVGSAGLAGLVNNAGLIVEGPIELVPIEEVRRQFEVNVIGQVAVTQTFLPLLRQARGRIVNIGAVTGKTSMPFLGILSASKAALESITDALRMELAPSGIQVITIEPSLIATPMWATSLAISDELRSRMSIKAEEYYGSAMASARSSAANVSRYGASPDKVAKVIADALTAQRPKTRYSVS